MNDVDRRKAYDDKVAALTERFAALDKAGKVKVTTGSTSNLFRYRQAGGNMNLSILDIGMFNTLIRVDEDDMVAEVEGAITFETLLEQVLEFGLVPRVCPELRHITVGGAIVGVGIESTGFRNGFVHDNVVEVDVLTGSGEVLCCNESNNRELFEALPNSYGTLGYILRAKIRLEPARRYVRVETTRYPDLPSYLAAFDAWIGYRAAENDVNFLEGLFYSKDAFFLSAGKFVDKVANETDILRGEPYYRRVSRESVVELSTENYLFRYDADWFWNIPEAGLYRLFREYAPRQFRTSKFYNSYVARKRKLLAHVPFRAPANEEQLIQDWEVPWSKAGELLEFVLEHVDLGGKPWVALPIRALKSPSLYPVRENELYMNLGCYCYTRKPDPNVDYLYTKIIDQECFRLGGLKMLYSSTFLDKEAFYRLYNGDAYDELKRRYDPDARYSRLYDKVIGSTRSA